MTSYLTDTKNLIFKLEHYFSQEPLYGINIEDEGAANIMLECSYAILDVGEKDFREYLEEAAHHLKWEDMTREKAHKLVAAVLERAQQEMKQGELEKAQNWQ